MDPFQGTQPMFGWPVGKPHVWFAWKPVRSFDGRILWLRRVYRQLVEKHDYLPGGGDRWFRYALRQGVTDEA